MPDIEIHYRGEWLTVRDGELYNKSKNTSYADLSSCLWGVCKTCKFCKGGSNYSFTKRKCDFCGKNYVDFSYKEMVDYIKGSGSITNNKNTGFPCPTCNKPDVGVLLFTTVAPCDECYGVKPDNKVKTGWVSWRDGKNIITAIRGFENRPKRCDRVAIFYNENYDTFTSDDGKIINSPENNWEWVSYEYFESKCSGESELCYLVLNPVW